MLSLSFRVFAVLERNNVELSLSGSLTSAVELEAGHCSVNTHRYWPILEQSVSQLLLVTHGHLCVAVALGCHACCAVLAGLVLGTTDTAREKPREKKILVSEFCLHFETVTDYA